MFGIDSIVRHCGSFGGIVVLVVGRHASVNNIVEIVVNLDTKK